MVLVLYWPYPAPKYTESGLLVGWRGPDGIVVADVVSYSSNCLNVARADAALEVACGSRLVFLGEFRCTFSRTSSGSVQLLADETRRLGDTWLQVESVKTDERAGDARLTFRFRAAAAYQSPTKYDHGGDAASQISSPECMSSDDGITDVPVVLLYERFSVPAFASYSGGLSTTSHADRTLVQLDAAGYVSRLVSAPLLPVAIAHASLPPPSPQRRLPWGSARSVSLRHIAAHVECLRSLPDAFVRLLKMRHLLHHGRAYSTPRQYAAAFRAVVDGVAGFTIDAAVGVALVDAALKSSSGVIVAFARLVRGTGTPLDPMSLRACVEWMLDAPSELGQTVFLGKKIAGGVLTVIDVWNLIG